MIKYTDVLEIDTGLLQDSDKRGFLQDSRSGGSHSDHLDLPILPCLQTPELSGCFPHLSTGLH